MTDAEVKLWNRIRSRLLGIKFRRQHPLGPYIVDFVCLERSLIIEVDGGQHAGSLPDVHRDEWLQEQGFRILRFWNQEVLGNIDGVLYQLLNELD